MPVKNLHTRASGILQHITALPSPFGIGDMGPGAYRFADYLQSAKQSYWQVLPLNPTDQACGNSPYSSISAYAGNTLLISPQILIHEGLLSAADIADSPGFPGNRCDYGSVIPYKERILDLSYEHFKRSDSHRSACAQFCNEQQHWLDDYALFVVAKKYHSGIVWSEWEKNLRDRQAKALRRIYTDFRDSVEREKYLQYIFFKQWQNLKTYCNERGIALIGDIPIYVSYDSADIWTNTEIFKLADDRKPELVAGVPPDYFSSTGQLWGNPVYRWDVLKKNKFKWWLQRIAHNLRLFDVLRIDHFRGFVAYWEVPAGETTAIRGSWVEASPAAFFTSLKKNFPEAGLIAEDLGVITPDVKQFMKEFGFPGMKVLQFAFSEDLPEHPYLPHNYPRNCIVYTGTHDNNTSRGWFEHETSPDDRQRLFRYCGRELSAAEVPLELIRLAMMSAADTVIVPLQDVLALGEEARMNRPSTACDNWEWRLLPEQLQAPAGDFLPRFTHIYGRE
jgi:4-alpha-glucanotransferase